MNILDFSRELLFKPVSLNMTLHVLLYLLISIPASWRLAILLTEDDGPFDLFQKMRDVIGVKDPDLYENFTTKLFSCLRCFSIWTSAFFTISFFVFPNLSIFLSALLAMSAGQLWLDKKHEGY